MRWRRLSEGVSASMFLMATVLLTGCHHPYDPQKNPLLMEPISEVVPALVNVEHQVRQHDLKNMRLANDDPGVSLVYACSMSPAHFETPEAPGSKICDQIFEKIVKAAQRQGGVLGSLTIEDLNDSEAQDRIHQALFSMAAYGHLPRAYSSSKHSLSGAY